MKVMYISPHLSTGGLPQYLLKKLEVLGNSIQSLVIEYADLGGDAFVVQKEQIKNVSTIKTLHDNKAEVLDVISNFKPDVIHFEEMPEYFMDTSIAERIYSNRDYKIVETTHDSSFDVNNKLFIPDEFLFVSNYSIEQFKQLNVPSKLVEYPIIVKERPNRTDALNKLGLSPDKVHVLNVGLFTPRKNQKEIAEYAASLLHLPVQFHFVGNQAGNFEHYWKPIMDTLPSNCKVWGERNDVDLFYSSMDLFLFTSKGTIKDKETNPLSIKEALMWDMPIFLYNLPVYLNKYDYVQNVKYLDIDTNKNLMLLDGFINEFKF
jgi:glycosyltransferase involved in cell wall biosynthesis